ncbi:MAG: DUF4328 domain-containing protein [Candidatus Nanopelagicales bacterium]
MTPPGWYRDPWEPSANSGQLRWWDGLGWTSAIANPASAFSNPDPRKDFENEVKYGRWARVGLIVGAASYLLLYPSSVFLASMFRESVDQLGLDRQSGLAANNARTAEVFQDLNIFSMAVNLINVGLLVAGVLFVLWFYHAATVARRLGMRARHSPAWAVGGFIVPIISFWWPYQSAMDCLPSDDVARGRVKWWWGLWIAMGVVGLATYIASFFSLTLGIGMAIVAMVIAVLAALAARDVIRAIERAHRAALAAMDLP